MFARWHGRGKRMVLGAKLGKDQVHYAEAGQMEAAAPTPAKLSPAGIPMAKATWRGDE